MKKNKLLQLLIISIISIVLILMYFLYSYYDSTIRHDNLITRNRIDSMAAIVESYLFRDGDNSVIPTESILMDGFKTDARGNQFFIEQNNDYLDIISYGKDNIKGGKGDNADWRIRIHKETPFTIERFFPEGYMDY